LSITTVSKTEFRLSGLPKGMFANWEDVEDVGQAELVNDQFNDYAEKLGFGVSIMPDGSTKPYYGGDDPKPAKPLTDAVTKMLEADFLRKRVLEAARATPEFQWLRRGRYKFTYPAATYKRDGTIALIFANEGQALTFKLAMGGA
jgi:hypothetical protein